ncbi:MAG: hypothetical protein ACRC46_03020 [Thermoguttaceae bacterium]
MYTIIFSLLVTVSSLDDSAAFKKLTVISPAKIREVASRELVEITTAESAKHAVEGFLANPTAIDCFDEVTYNYTGGRYNNNPIRFRLRTPSHVDPKKKYPLVVWFHGKGESDNDNKRQLAHIQATLDLLLGPSSIDCYIMATQCPQDNPSWTSSLSTEGIGDAPLTIAQEVFEAILDEYPIDTNKVSVFGLSSGGSAVWEFSRRNRGRIATIVPVSTNPPSVQFDTDAVVWAFNCTKDNAAPSASVKPLVDAINQSGGLACLTEVKSEGHDAWTYALKDMHVLRWMTEQKLGTKPYPPPGICCNTMSVSGAIFGYAAPLLLIVFTFCVRRRIM